MFLECMKTERLNTSFGSSVCRYASLWLFVLCAISAGGSFAQTIESVTVNKSINNVQTSAASVQIDPTPPGPLYGGPYGFGADVDGQNISSITAPTVSGPIVLNLPGHPSDVFNNNGTLVYNATDGGWRYGFPTGNDWGSPTLSDLNAIFGSGIYAFTVNGQTIPLNLTGDAYPNTPVLALSGGVWSGGKYLLDVSHPLTITTNTFSAYGSHVDDGIDIFVQGQGDFLQFHSATPGTNFFTFTAPAFSFVSGSDYDAGAAFLALVDVNTNAALPGSLNAAFYAVATTFVISAVPEPSSYAMLAVGFSVLLMTLRGRRV